MKKSTLLSVESITTFGIWMLVQNKEYFLSYELYPYFKDQTLRAIQNVQLLHGMHLYWPDLDVDLEIDNLDNPEKYPLISKKNTGPLIEAGMVLAIEPISSMGTGQVLTGDDNWTIITADRSLSAHFEHTVLVTEKGYEIIV